MTATARTVLAPDGPIARLMRDRGLAFEARPEQERMAQAVAEAFQGRAASLIEAGTGVGNSLARQRMLP